MPIMLQEARGAFSGDTVSVHEEEKHQENTIAMPSESW
jgi:hypothetical protein